MKLLLGADGSIFSRLAEEVLVRIPEWRSAEVTVASVAPRVTYGFASVEPDVPASGQADEVVAIAQREARDYADAAVSRLRDQDVDAHSVYLEGDAGSELLELAERESFDAIAVGSRGLGGFQSVLLGSVARKLVAHAPCHVLIARGSSGCDPDETLRQVAGQPKLIAVLGVDGSPGAQVAIEFVKRQGGEAFEKVVAACAEPLGAVPAGIDPASFVDLYRYDHERANTVSKRAAEELARSASEVVPETKLGRPAFAIGEIAAGHKADLVVCGATRHGAIERFLIGSTSYELATEAPCSVLVIRPPRA